MKKWLMLAFLPLLLLAQQEAGATPITTLMIYPPYPADEYRPSSNSDSGTIKPFKSFTLQMTDNRDEINITAVFESTVSLVAAANAQAPNTPVLSNSLIQLLITNNPPPGLFVIDLNIVTVNFNPSTNIVTSVSHDPFFTSFNVDTNLNEITATLGKTSETNNPFNTMSTWFDTDYWAHPPTASDPYACMREKNTLYYSALCGNNLTALRFPFRPVSVPVPNSSMLLMVGLAALMMPLRRTRQS